MDAQALIARVLAQRESWVELESGKEIKVRRPPAADMYQLRAAAKPELWLRCCVDWRGFSEADVVGAAHGSGNVSVPFDAELWVTLALDQPEWMAKVQAALVDAIKAYFDAKDAAGKN